MVLIAIGEAIVLQINFDLLGHLAVDVFATGTRDQSNNSEGKRHHGNDTVIDLLADGTYTA